MKGFLNKRRKSISGSPARSDSAAGEDAPPVPPFARQYGTVGMSSGENSPVGMPDLRFSKMDFGLDLSNIQVESRPVSVVVPTEEKRRSRMPFLNFGSSNGKAVTSTEDLQMNKLTLIPVKAASTTTVNEIEATNKIEMDSDAPIRIERLSKHQPQVNLHQQQQQQQQQQRLLDHDRKKLIASATEAMNLEVPVKAPERQHSAPPRQSWLPISKSSSSSHVSQSPQGGDDNNGQASSTRSKKELKREEKEKAAQEKERLIREKVLMAQENQRMMKEKERIAKQREKEAKERAIQEKENAAKEKEMAKIAAKDAKEASKKSKNGAVPTSKTSANVNSAAPRAGEKGSEKDAQGKMAGKGNQADPRKQRESASAAAGNATSSAPPPVSSLVGMAPAANNVRQDTRPPHESADSRSVKSSSNGPQMDPKKVSSRGPRNGPAPNGRHPGAPPAQRPPPPPVNGNGNAAKPPMQPQQQQNMSRPIGPPSSSNAEKVGMNGTVPRQPQGPRSQASQGGTPRSFSAIPAADGVPRPVVSRGSTQLPPPSQQGRSDNAVKTYGGPLTNSPEFRSTPGTAHTSSPQANNTKKGTLNSSSDEASSSTTVGAASIESATSFAPDSPTSNEGFEERFHDASPGFAGPRQRPRREEERAQSRLSIAMDAEINRSSSGGDHRRKESLESQHRFSALLMASRPGGNADRSTPQASERKAPATSVHSQFEAQRQQYLQHGSANAAPSRSPRPVRNAPPPPEPVKRAREAAPVPKRRNCVNPLLIDKGPGWSCLGVADINLPNPHEKVVYETVLKENVVPGEEEYEEVKVCYNDLFELIWTTTTPDVSSRLISHLDITDLKALRQTSASIRFALNVNEVREAILTKFLTCIGYRPWTYVKGSAPTYKNGVRVPGNKTTNDPCPLSLSDCEAFMISQDLLTEYAGVGKEFAAQRGRMDPRIVGLARASTRAYSRVLTRLRLQPVFRLPTPPAASSAPPSGKFSRMSRADNSSSGLSTPGSLLNSPMPDGNVVEHPRHNSYYPSNNLQDASNLSSPARSHSSTPTSFLQLDIPSATAQAQTPSGLLSPVSHSQQPSILSPIPASPLVNTAANALPDVKLLSPWKPGRAAFYRVWVPARDPSGWLSDEELSQCEAELYKAGVWNFLKVGDVIWDTAVGDQMNEGKYIFDGHYLRDLSYTHDVAGHLPSWLNCVLYSPSYWHNIIKSSTPRPVIYFDISPWKDQILGSLRLVQDHVESFSNTGSRYRVAKWLYRSAANISSGQIISKMKGGLEIVDEGWKGRIVIETDGTAENAKSLISRCAGVNATAQDKATLLATVMGDAAAANKMMRTANTNGLNPQDGTFQSAKNPAVAAPGEVQNSAWIIMRERSRPGLIWIKLAGA